MTTLRESVWCLGREGQMHVVLILDALPTTSYGVHLQGWKYVWSSSFYLERRSQVKARIEINQTRQSIFLETPSLFLLVLTLPST